MVSKEQVIQQIPAPEAQSATRFLVFLRRITLSFLDKLSEL